MGALTHPRLASVRANVGGVTQQQWGQQANRGQSAPGFGSTWSAPTGQRPYGSPASPGQPGFGGASTQGWGQQQASHPQWGGQWQQPHTPAPFPQQSQQSPKRRSPLLTLLIAGVVGIIAIALIASVVRNITGTGTQTTSTQYQQEDYKVPPPEANPPELPLPKVEADLETLTEQNKVYGTTVPNPTRCEMTEITLGSSSKAEIKSSMDELTACLAKVWDPALEQADWTFVRPVSNVYSTKITTPCGKVPTGNAFYCGGNQQIYLATDLNKVLPPSVASGRFVVETVIAHEVAHAVQYRTGIGASSAYMIQNLPKTQSLEVNRRLEVQADCFAGLFLASVAQSRGMTEADLENIRKTMVAIGDDTLSGDPDIVGNHGRGASRKYWVEMGMASTKVGACNTYVAPSTLVK